MFIILIILFFKVLEDEVVLNAINEAVHNVSANDDATTDKETLYPTELKIQQENAKCILTIMSANVKNWVYK